MRSSKSSRRIVVQGVEYRWRAKGDDGWISVGVWPANNVGAYIRGSFKYHETWIPSSPGSWSSAGDQIVVTNRVIRRIIEHAIEKHGYNPNVESKQLNLYLLDEVIRWDDAVRAAKNWK